MGANEGDIAYVMIREYLEMIPNSNAVFLLSLALV